MSDPFRDVEEAVAGDPSPQVLFWSKEIDLAKQREKAFRKEAEDVTKLYEAQKPAANSFNILYANTETLLPAVYNQTPRPLAEPRFRDGDPLARSGAEVIERTLQYLIDSPDQGYEQYDNLFRQAALGALVPGRGVTWFRYTPKIEDSETALGDGEETEGDDDAAGEEPLSDDQSVSGEVVPPEAAGEVTWETVCGEDVDYDKFLCGYARRWVNVPWVAREHSMSEEDAEENFGEEIAKELKYEDAPKDNESGWKAQNEGNNQGSTKTAVVYEIWWKQERKVLFYAPSLKGKLCLEMDDPYGLTGFYPLAQPLQFLQKRSTLVPTPLFKVYETQAKELNKITQRIARVLNALKVRGFYDGTIQGLKELFNSDDNTLLPAKNVAAMQQGQNLQNSIWLMPLEMLIKVLRELYVAQEQCKNVIYEITGIADIMRGSTQASETATAQSIKDKWGGLRLQNMQGAVQAYIRDSLRIVAELAGKHFGLETFAGMTGLNYATPQEVSQAEQLTAQINQALAQMPPAMPPAGGPEAGPPPAPPVPPQVAQAQQQVQAIMAKPKWTEVIALLRDNLHRGYKIDIETNSTLANTSAEDQENISKAMGAIAQALQQFIPAVQSGVMTLPAVKEILLSIARRFEFGRRVEQSILDMPNELPPPPPDPKIDEMAQKQKEEIAAAQADLDKASMDLTSREQQLAMATQKLQQEQKQVAVDIQNAKKEVEQTAKEALSEQKLAYKDLLLEMDKRVQKTEQQVQKGIAAGKANAEKATVAREKSMVKREQSDEKVLPALENLLKAHSADMQMLMKVLAAPVELTRDEKTGKKRAQRMVQ